MPSRIRIGPDGGPYVIVEEDNGDVNISSPNGNVDFQTDDISNVGALTADLVSTEDLISDSRTPQYVLREDTGIYYAVGQDGIVVQDTSPGVVINTVIDEIATKHGNRVDARQTAGIIDCNQLEITLNNQITLKGGVGLHNLFIESNVSGYAIESESGVIRGLCLENVYVNNADTGGFAFREMKNSTVRNCGAFNSTTNGMRMNGCLYNHFDRLTVNGVDTFHGYATGNVGGVQSNHNVWTACYANGVAENGFNIEDAWGNTFIGCSAEASGSGAADNSRGNSWIDFWSENVADYGLRFNDINGRCIGYRGFDATIEVGADNCQISNPFLSGTSEIVIESGVTEGPTLVGVSEADVVDNASNFVSAGPSGVTTDNINSNIILSSRYDTLQDAIDAASGGRMVVVDASFSSESVTIGDGGHLLGTGSMFDAPIVDTITTSSADSTVSNLRVDTAINADHRMRIDKVYNPTINIDATDVSVVGCFSVDVSSNGQSYAAVGNTSSTFDGNRVDNS